MQTSKNKVKERIKISVVTVCYNASTLLRKTIESVTGQRGGNFEYLIIDGKSTDTTPLLLDEVRDKVDIIVSEPDGGIYDAMNKGARLATGDYIIFMNAGDTFATDSTIARLCEAIDREATVVYGDVIKQDGDGREYVKQAEAPHNGHRMYFCHQSSLVAREAMLSTPFDTTHRLSADFKQMKTLYNQCAKFQQVDFAIARFDTTGVSNSRRSEGLRDNMRVIAETDGFWTRLRLMPRLALPYLLCRVRGK